MTSVRNLFALAALAVSTCAFAADAPGGYLLVGGGASQLGADCAGTTSCDKNGNAFKFVGGWRLGNSLAIEGVAFDFGKAKATVPINGLNVAGELKSKGFGVGVAVYGDFSPSWFVTGRLGVASMKGTTNVSAPGVTGSVSATSTQAYAGVGVAYRFTDSVSAELGFDSSRAKFSGDQTFTVSAFTLGVGVKF